MEYGAQFMTLYREIGRRTDWDVSPVNWPQGHQAAPVGLSTPKPLGEGLPKRTNVNDSQVSFKLNSPDGHSIPMPLAVGARIRIRQIGKTIEPGIFPPRYGNLSERDSCRVCSV